MPETESLIAMVRRINGKSLWTGTESQALNEIARYKKDDSTWHGTEAQSLNEIARVELSNPTWYGTEHQSLNEIVRVIGGDSSWWGTEAQSLQKLNELGYPSAAGGGFDKTSLISWWDLEEESGTRFDAHGDNDLTDNNTVTQATGIVGNAAAFDQANTEYLSINDNPSLSMGAGVYFTFGIWVYRSSATQYGLGFIGKWDTGNNEYLLYVGPPYYIFALTHDGTTYNQISTGTEPTVGVWEFVIAWYDGVNAHIQVDNGTIYSVGHTTGIYDGVAAFEIGAFQGTTYPMNGRLDSGFVFKRVLTADERTWLYNAGAGRQYSDL